MYKLNLRSIREKCLRVAAPTSAPTDSEIFDDEDEPRQPKMRSLRDLYDSTDEVHLVCLLEDA